MAVHISEACYHVNCTIVAYYMLHLAMAENQANDEESSYERAQSLMKTELPEYVVNIFLASGYDRLESIAKINNQTIDEMITHTNNTFDGDCLRLVSYIFVVV